MPSQAQSDAGRAVSNAIRWLPLAAGTVGAASGLSSMAGWIAGIPRLIDWDLDGITIKFNAAVCLTALSAGLLISILRPKGIWIIRAIGCFTLAVAGLTLAEHFAGFNTGIDTWFFDEAPSALATAAPGRMGVPASSVIFALSVSLILLTYRRWRAVASSVALGAMSVTSLSITGYLFGASQLYAVPKWTGIALQTATTLALISLGIISLIRDRGIAEILSRSDAGGRMIRSLIFPVIGIALSLGYVRVQVQDYGFVDTAFGTAMRSVLEIVLLLSLLWWTAERLSRSEAAARDAMRSKAENETHRRIAGAQESERRRIARDVHDHIGQQVTGLRLRLESLCRRDDFAHKTVEELRSLRDQAMKLDSDLSLLVWQMRPSVLDSHGLASALNSFIREWSKNHDIEAEFHSPSSNTRLPPDIETNLYRIIQEALNNILKHARASRVSVSLNYVNDEAVLLIEDNGAGFDPDPESIHTTEGSGFGLIGMKERAALVGGTLEIESRAGDGTAIMVRIPRARKVRAATP